MREQIINKRATTAKIEAVAATILSMVLCRAELKFEGFNVWEKGVQYGLVYYLAIIVLAGLPISQRWLRRWEGFNYSRSLSLLLAIRAGIDVVILCGQVLCGQSNYIAPAIIATIICFFFTWLRIGTKNKVPQFRAEELL